MTPEQMRKSGYLRIFASYYKPHLAIFLLDMLCALGISLVDLAFPLVSRYAMQHMLPQRLFGLFFAVMAALLLGLVGGIFLHMFIMRTVEVDMVMFGRDIKPLSFVLSAVLTVVFSLLVNLGMKRKLRNISMVESMKAPE